MNFFKFFKFEKNTIINKNPIKKKAADLSLLNKVQIRDKIIIKVFVRLSLKLISFTFEKQIKIYIGSILEKYPPIIDSSLKCILSLFSAWVEVPKRLNLNKY